MQYSDERKRFDVKEIIRLEETESTYEISVGVDKDGDLWIFDADRTDKQAYVILPKDKIQDLAEALQRISM